MGGAKALATATGGDQEEAPVGGTVPATLALTLGAPASFGAFTPGVAREYYCATTTATVVSTAGDATLTVVRPVARRNTGKLVNGAFALPQTLQVPRGLGAFAPWRLGRADTLRTYSGRSPTAVRSSSSSRSAPTTRCARGPTRRR